MHVSHNTVAALTISALYLDDLGNVNQFGEGDF